MKFNNIETDQLNLDKDIELLSKFPIEILGDIGFELLESAKQNIPFSKNKLEDKRLNKIGLQLVYRYKEATSTIVVEKISKLNLDHLDLNQKMNLLSAIGNCFGVLIKICVGNLICDQTDNPFKELYEKYITVLGKEKIVRLEQLIGKNIQINSIKFIKEDYDDRAFPTEIEEDKVVGKAIIGFTNEGVEYTLQFVPEWLFDGGETSLNIILKEKEKK